MGAGVDCAGGCEGVRLRARSGPQRAGPFVSVRRRVAVDGWAPLRGWCWRLVGVGVWWTAAALVALTAWWAIFGDADWAGQADAVRVGAGVRFQVWVRAGVGLMGAVAVIAYAAEMGRSVRLLWLWRPWRAHSGMAPPVDREVRVQVFSRVSRPWLRRPTEVEWVRKDEPPEAAGADVVAAEPADAAPVNVEPADGPADGEAAVGGDVAEPDVDAEAVESEGGEDDSQGTLELDGDWDDGAMVVRLLSPMSSLWPAQYETLVWCVLHRRVVVHKEMMGAIDLSQEAVTKRCKRLVKEGWLLRNQDRSYRLAPDVVTDVELLHNAAAGGDEQLAGRIARSVRAGPLPQLDAEWVEEAGPESFRAVVARDAQEALTECIEAFGDEDGVFVRATDAVWDL